MSNNIVLIGFMGCGKTTIGREIANRNNMVMIDTDIIIESNSGMTISNIFNKYGENKFRSMEISLCEWIKNNVNNAVISVGGGTPTVYDVSSIGVVFYLEAPFNALKKRVEKSLKKRPKFQNISQAKTMYDERLITYKNASNHIINALDSTECIVSNILNIVKGDLN